MLMDVQASLDLADYRRQVAILYAVVRNESIPAVRRWRMFRKRRDELFRSHPQSALNADGRRSFRGLEYYPYDPAWRLTLPVVPSPQPAVFELDLRDDGTFRFRRFGQVRFEAAGQQCTLSIYWIMGYGGGIFIPFRDTSNGNQTYGGGRYIIDTIKNADLGLENGRLILDFNFAYNPSCAYDDRWDCALAPVENWLEVEIPAGEKKFHEVDS